MAEQDAAFNASLEADRLKEEERNGILLEEQRLNDLMMARKSRVPPDPELTTSTEYVAVRHVKLGTKSRLFRSSSLFSVVYDWIGSLSNTPEFYEIKDHKGVTVQPDAKIISGTYNMVCSDSPPLLVSDGEISFQGFGNSKESLDEPYNDLQALRGREKEKYTREQISVIKRDDIYESMINLYKKKKREKFENIFKV